MSDKSELEAIRARDQLIHAHWIAVAPDGPYADRRTLLAHVDALDSAATALSNHVQFCESLIAQANKLLRRYQL